MFLCFSTLLSGVKPLLSKEKSLTAGLDLTGSGVFMSHCMSQSLNVRYV